MCNEVEMLKKSLKERNPSVLLGAGFSYDVHNKMHQKLPLGQSLAEELYTHMYVDCNDNYATANKNAVEQIRTNLRELCSVIRAEGTERVAKRNIWLKERFSGCYSPESYYSFFAEYPWSEIFTLNIDDFVETLFDEDELIVWDNELHGHQDINHPLLIKLHGSVSERNPEFVFDNHEYANFTSKQNCLLREFGDVAIKKDIIFIGTEYQEDDLRSIIESFKNIGYRQNVNYFFVCPNINSITLQIEIKSNPQYHWIQWTTKQFLEFLHNEITVTRDFTCVMKEKGMIFIDESDLRGPRVYNSDLYTGEECRYADFWQNWDIENPKVQSCVNELINAETNTLLALHGPAYCGKTCFARRLLVNLSIEGYLCREYKISDITSKENLLKYLETLPSNCKVAILYDNAAYGYSFVGELLEQIPEKIARFHIICVDSTINHKRKRYSINTNSNFSNIIEYAIDEKVNVNYAKQVLAKLKEKRFASKLFSKYKTDRNIIVSMKQINDIIEILYIATSGRGYENHFKQQLNSIESPQIINLLIGLTALSALGIESLPLRIMSEYITAQTGITDMNNFAVETKNLISFVDQNFKIRCSRLILKSGFKITDTYFVIDLLHNLIIETSSRFDEYTMNEWCAIFQKILHQKTLIDSKVLSPSDAKILFDKAEDVCSNFSYYWVQRGLLEERLCNFEKAEIYLLNAQTIRQNSYQVQHAIAKNHMERGLYELEQNRFAIGEEYFNTGLEEMKHLVINNEYSKARAYSVHSLISMILKFTKVTSRTFSYDQCNYIKFLICNTTFDAYLYGIVDEFIQYCIENEYYDISNSIKEYKSFQSRKIPCTV